MTKKKQISINKLYLILSEEDRKFFSSFTEAEVYAKDLCEINDEDVDIFEISQAWNVYFPVQPEPELSPIKLETFIDDV